MQQRAHALARTPAGTREGRNAPARASPFRYGSPAGATAPASSRLVSGERRGIQRRPSGSAAWVPHPLATDSPAARSPTTAQGRKRTNVRRETARTR